MWVFINKNMLDKLNLKKLLTTTDPKKNNVIIKLINVLYSKYKDITLEGKFIMSGYNTRYMIGFTSEEPSSKIINSYR